jgi:hypothetical protein
MVQKWSVWVAIARRQLWFNDLVEARLSDVCIDDDAIVHTSDPTVLRSIIKLTDRIERHHARMRRHADRASDQ